jgi:hypothetical protein
MQVSAGKRRRRRETPGLQENRQTEIKCNNNRLLCNKHLFKLAANTQDGMENMLDSRFPGSSLDYRIIPGFQAT